MSVLVLLVVWLVLAVCGAGSTVRFLVVIIPFIATMAGRVLLSQETGRLVAEGVWSG